jgi:serine/threonine protein kinase
VGKSSARELPKTIGRYEVVRQLGVGAMGRVFLARDPVLERHVAIKVLREDLHIAEEDRESLLVRMRHEARAAARVTHPNLCVIHDMGEDDDLGLYLVFEYIEGPTLKQRLEEGRLTPRQAARVAKEIGAALTFAHERGVLHRDVKPENLILSPTGTKLTDFGIARVPDSTLTHAGGLLGTPAYSAPETFQRGTFSPESDQFSFAATLYEAIRGARAFPGDDAISVASKIANDPPEAFATSLRYAPELDELLQRGMAKAPEERMPSCEELGNELTELLMLRTTLTGPEGGRVFEASTLPSRTSHAARMKSVPPPRSSLRWFALGVVALIGLGLLVRSALRHKPQTHEERPTPSAESSLAQPASAPPSTPRPRKPPPPRPPAPTSKPVEEPRPTSSAYAPPAP